MRSKSVVKPAPKDSKKEKTYKLLAQILTDAGYIVRREELKRGFGWKVVSGTCRLNEEKIIFVDRRMTQEDQLSFLTSKIANLDLAVSNEIVCELDALGWKLRDGAPVAGEDTQISDNA